MLNSKAAIQNPRAEFTDRTGDLQISIPARIVRLLTTTIFLLTTIGCMDSGPCPDASGEPAGRAVKSAAGLYVGHADPYAVGTLPIQSIDLDRCQNSAPWPMRIHAPTLPGTYPIVVFEHGFMASNSAYDEVLAHVASHGFVVVAPQLYELTINAFVGDPSAVDEAARLKQVLNWAPAHLEAITAVTIRFDLVGLSGHSRGAKVAYILMSTDASQFTALAAVDPVDDGGGPMRNQPRVVSGPFQFSLPTLIIGTGMESDCAPKGENYIKFYAATQSPVWEVVGLNQSHTDLLDEDQAALAALVCNTGPDRPGMRRLTAGLLTAFFRATLQGDANSYGVLTDSSSTPIPVTLQNK